MKEILMYREHMLDRRSVPRTHLVFMLLGPHTLGKWLPWSHLPSPKCHFKISFCISMEDSAGGFLAARGPSKACGSKPRCNGKTQDLCELLLP